MASYVGEQFYEMTVEIENHSYKDCTFTRCALVYRGSANTDFVGNTFNDCHWVLRGAASNTIAFLRAVYQKGWREDIEGFLDDIRGFPNPLVSKIYRGH